MSDELPPIEEANAEEPEATDARAILKKGDRIEVNGHTFVLAMNVVIEGKRSDMLMAELNPL
jgi:hypothetical protein